jgi:hypothetical protein
MEAEQLAFFDLQALNFGILIHFFMAVVPALFKGGTGYFAAGSSLRSSRPSYRHCGKTCLYCFGIDISIMYDEREKGEKSR